MQTPSISTSKSANLGRVVRTPLSASVRILAGAIVLSLPHVVLSQAPQQAAARTQVDAIKAREQMPSLQTPADNGADTVPQLYPGESGDIGTQKLLTQKPVIRYFEATADTSFSYTTDALLDGTRRDTGISATTLSLAFAPPELEVGSGKLSLRTGYRHLAWLYDLKRQDDSSTGRPNLNAGDFQLSSFFISGRYSFLEKWSATFGVDHNRILMLDGSSWSAGRLFDSGKWNEVYTEFNPNWALERALTFTPKVNGSVSLSGGYHFSRSEAVASTHQAADRLDNAVMASVMYSPVDKWLIQPFSRVSYTMYTRSGEVSGHAHRRDLTESFGMNLMWAPTERVAFRVSVSGEFRQSNDPTMYDYGKFDAGTGVSFSIKF